MKRYPDPTKLALANLREEVTRLKAFISQLSEALLQVVQKAENEFGDEARDDPQPFFTHALPCESCGKPCDELHVPYWDSDLHVGMCCAIHSDEWINDTEPTCEALYRLVSHCKTVAEVSDAFEVHAHSGCLLCCPRKEAGAEVETKQERRAA